VEDTGIGIAPEEIDVLFDAFVQTASGRISPGAAGLALAISCKFVQMMGRDIHFMSVVMSVVAKLNAKLSLQLIAQTPQEHSLLARAIEEKVSSFDFEQIVNLAQLSITI
jgi:signal transduction histidine kinase